MNRRTPAVFSLLLVLSSLVPSAAAAAEPDWYFQHPDSFPRLPTNKLFYLEQKHGLCPSQRQRDLPESLNVRMVGKWGGGPSWAVTGKDTLVYLSRGSEVVVVNFADTANPRVLNYIQAKRLAGRPVLSGNLLYLVTSGYIEVFDVSDPRNAPRVGRLSVPVADIDVQDSLVYLVGADSFMVYNFADPANPVRLGVCRDSGYALDVDRGYAYLRDRWGMYILDATDPASPRRVASWGTDIAGVKVRGNHCYVAQGQMGSGSLHVLNVQNPANPWEEGRLSGLTGEDIYLVDTLLFTCEFDIVSVADSSRPRLIGHLAMPQDRHGVWAEERLRRAYVAANYAGLQVVDLRSLPQPVMDTWLLPMGYSQDLAVNGSLACVAAQFGTGLTVLDIGSPGAIRELANLDTAGIGPSCEAVVVRDSLAYISWRTWPGDCFRVIDISNPTRPYPAARVTGFDYAKAMVLRDSFLYCAEDYKFEVFSVADPRQPVWRGSCNLSEASTDVVVKDSLAFVANLPTAVINIASPSLPVVIGTMSDAPYGIAVYDTFAYLAVNYGGLKIWSIANPRSPRRVDTLAYPRGYEVEVAESVLLYGGLDFRVLDLATPSMPREVGSYETPYRTRKIDWDGRYCYAACYLAGICVLERLATGVAECSSLPSARVYPRATPSPTHRYCQVDFGPTSTRVLGLFDGCGRAVLPCSRAAPLTGTLTLDLSQLPSGVYFLRLAQGQRRLTAKVVKR